MENLINDEKYNGYDFDDVPRVSTDGNPHGVLTLVVCLSGLFVATFVVSLVIFVLRKTTKNEFIMMQNISSSQAHLEAQRQLELEEQEPGPSTREPKIRIFSIFGSSKQSFDLNN